jgi:plastocyanin
MSIMHATPSRNVAGLLFAALAFAETPAHHPGDPVAVSAKLSEWSVKLSQGSVAAGAVTFTITNAGTIPHAFEVEGQGIERETDVIQPGKSATLTLTLKAGTYEVYCPVGDDSHKKLGMETHLKVVSAQGAGASGYGASGYGASGHGAGSSTDSHVHEMSDPSPSVKSIRVTGGGPVIQILPGPFPFPDSAAPILEQFGPEKEGLESEVKNGPYSNNVAPISGTFTFSAWDKGAVRDSVDGIAEFTAQDGSRWKLVLDRVQTKDVPHHPRFGGVIMGLYYHGNTAVHTPLVPTINSAVALWAFGHLYKNDALVTDNAMVHVMLLSRTREDGDFKLACWDCSKNTIEETQLQILHGPGEPPFDTPGGFLFVNWEKSSGRRLGS